MQAPSGMNGIASMHPSPARCASAKGAFSVTEGDQPRWISLSKAQPAASAASALTR